MRMQFVNTSFNGKKKTVPQEGYIYVVDSVREDSVINNDGLLVPVMFIYIRQIEKDAKNEVSSV